jgi:hypothetical protein
MKIKELILELLNEDMSEDLYFRYEDDAGNIRYFYPDGICFDSDRFQNTHGVKYVTIALEDA